MSSETLANLSNEDRRFDPPADLAADANVTEEAYARADADREAFWAEAAGRLDWGQKWDQVQAARALDAAWTKPQVLEAYLNLVSFRGELQGVGSAARALFGKAPSGLNVAESVILAALVRAPSADVALVTRRACALAVELHSATPCRDIGMTARLALARQVTAAPLPDRWWTASSNACTGASRAST